MATLRQVTGALARHMVVEAPRPRVVREWPYAPWLAVATVCFGAFLGQLDASIVTLALPALGSSFHVGLAGVEWVSLAYLLTLVALLAGVGRLADAWGRKQLYLYGFALFALASAACGFAPTLGALIGFRVVQAVGAALLQANSVALVTTSVPADRMRLALGVQAAAQALGLAVGPTLGGVLVGELGWRWVFWVNLPVAAVGIVAGRYLLPRTTTRNPARSFDLGGLALLATAAGALLLALSAASGLAVPGWAVAALLVASALAAAGFVAVEARVAAPLVDLAALRRPAVSGGLAAALGGYLLLFGPLVLVPVLLTARGGSVVTAGLVTTALPVGFGLAAILGGRVVPRSWSDRRRCVAGALGCAVALAALVVVAPSPPALFGALGVVGLGLGLFTPANNTLVLAAVPAQRRGVGGGLVNMARGLGTSLGVAAVALTLHLAGGDGPRLAFAMLAAVGIAVAVLAHLAGSGEDPV